MLVAASIFLAFFIPFAGMVLVYYFLLWYSSGIRSSSSSSSSGQDVKPKFKGLSPLELQKLPSKIAGEELKGKECSVCLDEIEIGQITRFIPDCKHGLFHLQCVDTWLSMNPVCPICRSNLDFSTPPPPPPLNPYLHDPHPENLC